MKIGVFGGTFDPPHNGHLIIADYVRHRLGLNKVLFVPSWISPHKQDRQATSAADRLAMLLLAVERAVDLEVSDIEVRRGGVSYTIDTLRHLSGETRAELYLLIGADNFVDFDTWHEPEEIVSLARLVVMSRPGFPLDDGRSLPSGLIRVEVPEITITATYIRDRIRARLPIRYLLPARVERYIQERNLYKD